jgi:hypothetical protein
VLLDQHTEVEPAIHRVSSIELVVVVHANTSKIGSYQYGAIRALTREDITQFFIDYIANYDGFFRSRKE